MRLSCLREATSQLYILTETSQLSCIGVQIKGSNKASIGAILPYKLTDTCRAIESYGHNSRRLCFAQDKSPPFIGRGHHQNSTRCIYGCRISDIALERDARELPLLNHTA